MATTVAAPGPKCYWQGDNMGVWNKAIQVMTKVEFFQGKTTTLRLLGNASLRWFRVEEVEI